MCPLNSTSTWPTPYRLFRRKSQHRARCVLRRAICCCFTVSFVLWRGETSGGWLDSDDFAYVGIATTCVKSAVRETNTTATCARTQIRRGDNILRLRGQDYMPRLKGRKMGISQTSARVKRKARRDHDARLRGASTLVALAAESSSDSASTATTGDSVTPTDTPVSDSSTAQLPQLPPGARRAKRARATGAQIVADVDVPQQEWPPLAATRAPRARPRH